MIHLGANKVSGEHLVLCKENTFDVKSEANCFLWMSVETGRRQTGEPQMISVVLIRLVCLMQCFLLTLAACRIDSEHKCP